MPTFLAILKVALPIIVQILGAIFTAYGAHQAGVAKNGNFSMAEQVKPVYGNAGIGIALLGGGILASHLIGKSATTKAAQSPPSVPQNDADAVQQAQINRYMELASKKDSPDDDLDFMNAAIKTYRNRWAKK